MNGQGVRGREQDEMAEEDCSGEDEDIVSETKQ